MQNYNDYEPLKRAIGKRFKFFRQLMSKSRKDFEDEANNMEIAEERIAFIEKSVTVPNIIFIQYFTEEYGLSLTWLVTGRGKMFYKQGPKTPADIFKILQENDLESKIVKELHLLQIQKIKRAKTFGNSQPGQGFNEIPNQNFSPRWVIYDSSQR